jgi:hypothetical protein
MERKERRTQMGLDYLNLDATTRGLMDAEIDRDITGGTLYLSDNLSPAGMAAYPGLLKSAAVDGSDDSLAVALRPLLNSHEKPRQLKSGGVSVPPVMRNNAHEMLGEGEFNRFYIRALCLRAIPGGGGAATVEVYRAKQVQHARSASAAKIGTRVSAQALLDDLRTHPGIDTALGLPPGPNSGLSVKL